MGYSGIWWNRGEIEDHGGGRGYPGVLARVVGKIVWNVDHLGIVGGQ